MTNYIRSLLMVCLLTNAFFFIQAQNMEYQFGQHSIQGDTLTLPIEARSDVAGTFLNDLSLYFIYNPSAFSTSIITNNKIEITPMGFLTGEFSGTPKYTINPVDNSISRVAIIATSNFSALSPNDVFHNEVPTTFSLIFEIKMVISNPSEVAGIAFDENLMNGESFYLAGANLPVAYGNPNTYINDLLNVPLSNCNLSATSNTTPTACDSNTGSAETSITGGTVPYTVLLGAEPPVNTNDVTIFENLQAGTYMISVTDATGCFTSEEVEVEEAIPSPFAITGFTTAFEGDIVHYTIVPFNENSTYEVSVNGAGSIISQNNGLIQIQWNEGTGLLSITETDTNTVCIGETIALSVNILDPNNALVLTPFCNTMTVEWLAAATTTSTKVFKSIDGGNFLQVSIENDENYNDYIPNNLEGSSVCYYIEQLQQDGSSIVSDTTCATALVAPQDALTLMLDNVTPYSAEISWTFSPLAAIDSFAIQQNGTTIATVDNSTFNYTISELLPNTQYTYRVVVTNVCGEKISNALSIETLADCQAPTDLSIDTISTNQNKLSWQDNCLSETAYLITRLNKASNEITQFTTAFNTTKYNDYSVEADTEYCYVVNASSEGVLSNPTDTVCVTTPNDCNYALQDAPIQCATGMIVMTLGVKDNICNVNGFDITLVFNKDRYQFEGMDVAPNFGVDAGTVSYQTYSPNDTTLRITVYLDQGAGSNTFCGIDELFKVKFSLINNLPLTDESIQVTNFLETRVGGAVHSHCVDEALVLLPNVATTSGVIKYAYSGQLMGYVENETQPTYVTGGSDESGGNVSSNTYTVDDKGIFDYPISDGKHIQIDRDIDNDNTDVFFVIGGGPGLLIVQQLALGEPLVGYPNALRTPTKFDFLIADVDANGAITGGDLSLLMQRKLSLIGEFPGGRDWIFIDSLTLVNNPHYQLSSTVPEDDGIGISRHRVPKVPLFLEVPHETGSACTTYPTTVYYGYMLGNFQEEINLSLYKSKKMEEVVFDVENAMWSEGMISIPVYTSINEAIYTFDFVGLFNHEALTFESIELKSENRPNGYTGLHNILNGNNLLFTSYALSEYPNSGEETPLFYINLKVESIEDLSNLSDCILHEFNAIVNGEAVTTIVKGCEILVDDIDNSFINSRVSIQPNPAKDQFIVSYPAIQHQLVNLELIDFSGRVIQPLKINPNGETIVPVTRLSNGLYFVKIKSTEGFAITKVVVAK